MCVFSNVQEFCINCIIGDLKYGAVWEKLLGIFLSKYWDKKAPKMDLKKNNFKEISIISRTT